MSVAAVGTTATADAVVELLDVSEAAADVVAVAKTERALVAVSAADAN